MAAPNDGLFSGWTSIRAPRERKTALALVLTVPVTLAIIGFAFHQITPTQVALLFVGGMVFVTLARGRLLGSSIRVRETEFPEVVAVVERIARRLGVTPPQIFIRDDYFVPVNAIGLGEPYALVISSQYLQLLGPEELAFMIGREIGHIGAGNTRLLSLIVATGRTNPLIASLFGGWIRQTEYTADRAGVLCVAPDDAIKAIAMSTFHASGRRVEAAMLADQRKHIVADVPGLKGYFQTVQWLIYFPYATLLVATAGRTIGMMILDLRVVREDRTKPSIGQTVWRYVVGFARGLAFVPLLFFWRGYLWERWSKTRLIGGRRGLG